jgi:hypothetical protein
MRVRVRRRRLSPAICDGCKEAAGSSRCLGTGAQNSFWSVRYDEAPACVRPGPRPTARRALYYGMRTALPDCTSGERGEFVRFHTERTSI